MRDQGALDLRRAQPVPRHVEHVVDPAGDPVVAVLVPAAAVAGEVHALVGAEVRLDEALVVAVDRPRLAGPGALEAEVAAPVVAFEFVAVGVHQHRLDAEEGKRRRAGDQRRGARQRGDQDAARLRLPPGVDDRTLPVADHVVVPVPDLGVDRFADRTEDAKGAAVVGRDPLVAFARDRPQRGRGGVEEGHPQVVDDLPVAARVGVGRHRLEHDAGGAVRERAVDDVAVSRDPADVGGAEVDVVVVVIEDQPVGHRGVEQVAAGGVEHALRLARRAAGVEHEERRLGVEPRHRGGRPLLRRLLVQPQVASRRHRHLGIRAPRDQHVLDQVQSLDGPIAGRLERDRAAAAQTFVRGHQQAATGVDDPLAQAVGGEAREDDRMHRTDPRAGKHRVGQLRDHRQVDADPVARADPERGQHVGDPADVPLQLPVADPVIAARLVLDPDQGGLVGPGGGVAVDAVRAGVQHAVLEPGEVDGLEVPATRRPRLGEPVQGTGLFEPEAVRILDRLPVELPVSLHAVDVGAAASAMAVLTGIIRLSLRPFAPPRPRPAAPPPARPPRRCSPALRSCR